MTTPSLRHRTYPLLLIVSLAAPWPAAASSQRPRAAQKAAPTSIGLVGRSWSFFQNLWSAEGCMLDPNGRCLTGTTSKADTDTGCMLDPNGHCHS